jgi:Cap4 dsDNA endonuclease
MAGTTESSIGPLFDRPETDEGAETQARFRFQHHCAARRAVSLLVRPTIQSLVCEWHDDYLVLYGDGTQELVSVKHRESSLGAWTVAQLCSGGLGRLFERWLKTGRACRCCLETNAGLRSGEHEAAGLRRACAGTDDAARHQWAARIAKQLGPSGDTAQVEAFLSVLSIDSGLPNRHHIRPTHVDTYMRPAMEQLGLPAQRAGDAYDRIVECIAEASRDEDDTFDALLAIADPLRLTSDPVMSQTLRRRTLDRPRLIHAITGPALGIQHLLVPSSEAPDPTVLVKKLKRGGLGPTGINSAKRLRSSWLRFRNAWSADLPGTEPEFDHLCTKLLHVVQQAETASIQTTPPYGPRMQRELEARVAATSLGQSCGLPIEDEAILGFVYDMTDDCVVWWSDEFDVMAV